MATQYPWFPFYAADWTQGVAHMTATQRGIYISLLAYQWANGSVPAHADACGRIAGASHMDEADWVVVSQKFIRDGAVMRNQRLEECRQSNKNKSDSAKRAAAVRWGVMRPQCERNADAMRTQCESESQSESHIKPPIAPPSRKGGRRRRLKELEENRSNPDYTPF